MHLSYLIKPASSLCNMACKYCFYANVASQRSDYSYGIMQEATIDNLVTKTLLMSNKITYAFQGGEPTMAGLDFFKIFVNKVNEKKHNQIIHYSIQTNGINLDDSWLTFFKANHFLVGISLDGTKANHDQVRLTNQSSPTYDLIMKNIKKIKQAQINYNILTVITRQVAKDAKRLYNFYKKNELQYIQLIPCLPELDQSTDNYYLTSQMFFWFYNELFDLWYHDVTRGEYISISLFDHLLTLFKGVAPSMCGMLGFCTLQYVIEANGNVYPCDFYCLDEYLLGNINEDELSSIQSSRNGQKFIQEPKRMSPLCHDCKFKKLCNGNCKRMNVVYFDDKYCGYQAFLTKTYQRFYQLANQIK